MPLASDTTTGSREDVDRDIIAAAAAGSRPRGAEPSHQSSTPIVPQGDHLRGPSYGPNISGHTNPVPSVIYGPGRESAIDKEIVDQLAMKAGALTTVPEVEDKTTGVAAWDAEIARRSASSSSLDEAIPSYGAGARAGNPQSALLSKQKDADEREMSAAEHAFKSGVRSTRRGVNQGGTVEKTQAMTSAEYAALSPQQKAAVELNSMLVEAVAADLGTKQKGNPGGDEYDNAVEKLFTGEGKTAPYAPNTVGVLENIGWSGPATDLEDILSGKLLFTRQDIEDIAPERDGVAPDASLNTAEHLRDELQASLVKSFAAARKEPIQGKNLLAAKQELLDYDKIPGFSDTGREVVPGVTVGKFIQSGFDLLTNSNSGFTPEQIIADARTNLDPKEFQAFLNFVDINSRDAKKFRQPLGTNPDQTYFDPVEFRKSIAGLLSKER